MTSRYQTLTVTLGEPIREDDLQAWIDAIRMMDKVIDVEPEPVETIAKHQARTEMRQEVYEALEAVFDPK